MVKPFPPLPEFRVNAGHPFETTGVDYAGPLYIKIAGERDAKAYIFLFTCAWSRAVHLELVPDLGSSACVRGLRRFFGRRGVSNLMISDNAKTFKSEETRAFLRDRRVSWDYITPKAPWMGGMWERLVRSTKRCLRKVLRNACLTYEELETVLIEIEATINNRPITYIDTDDNAEALTPNHLMHGRALPIIAESCSRQEREALTKQTVARRRLIYRQRLMKNFVRMWQNEYLLCLRNTRPKSNLLREPVVGDVVLIQEGATRSAWKLARIVELSKGRDGQVRSALVKLGQTQNLVRRPIVSLYPLELSDKFDC